MLGRRAEEAVVDADVEGACENATYASAEGAASDVAPDVAGACAAVACVRAGGADAGAIEPARRAEGAGAPDAFADASMADAGVLAEIEAFCRALEVERNASAHTVRNYRIDLVDYARWAYRAGFDALHVTHKQLRLYLGELDQARYARTTVNRRLSALRSFFRWLVVTQRVDADPASLLQGPKKPKGLPHVIKPAEMVRLLSVHAACDAVGNPRAQSFEDMRDQALLEFLYACGVRVSEASGLKAADVDFELGQVKVFGKGSKERIVPIHELAARSMRAYGLKARPQLLREKPCEFFFVSTRGNRMTEDAIRKMFKATVRVAGLDEGLSPHAMRHTFATDVLAGGADLRSVQEMLGHASLSTTQIYTHVSPERLRDVHAQAHPRG